MFLSMKITTPAETKESFLHVGWPLMFTDIVGIQLRNERFVFFVGKPCVRLRPERNEIQWQRRTCHRQQWPTHLKEEEARLSTNHLEGCLVWHAASKRERKWGLVFKLRTAVFSSCWRDMHLISPLRKRDTGVGSYRSFIHILEKPTM